MNQFTKVCCERVRLPFIEHWQGGSLSGWILRFPGVAEYYGRFVRGGLKVSAVLGRCMPWLAYPGTVTLGLLLHAWLSETDRSLFVSAYTPVLMAALVVTFLGILE